MYKVIEDCVKIIKNAKLSDSEVSRRYRFDVQYIFIEFSFGIKIEIIRIEFAVHDNIFGKTYPILNLIQNSMLLCIFLKPYKFLSK
jgi:hypothetical protein